MNSTFTVLNMPANTPNEEAILAQLGDAKPVIIYVDAQEIGELYVGKASPNKFAQYLLSKFKDTKHVPVEGADILRLAHGQVVKFKEPPEKGTFAYCWLPENYFSLMEKAGAFKQNLF